MKLPKGMSINVSLSDEQMEHIAGITADKVNQTKSHSQRQEEHYIHEIKKLEDTITELNKIVVGNAFSAERFRDRLIKLRKKNTEYSEALTEIGTPITSDLTDEEKYQNSVRIAREIARMDK